MILSEFVMLKFLAFISNDKSLAPCLETRNHQDYLY